MSEYSSSESEGEYNEEEYNEQSDSEEEYEYEDKHHISQEEPEKQTLEEIIEDIDYSSVTESSSESDSESDSETSSESDSDEENKIPPEEITVKKGSKYIKVPFQPRKLIRTNKKKYQKVVLTDEEFLTSFPEETEVIISLKRKIREYLKNDPKLKISNEMLNVITQGLINKYFYNIQVYPSLNKTLKKVVQYNKKINKLFG